MGENLIFYIILTIDLPLLVYGSFCYFKRYWELERSFLADKLSPDEYLGERHYMTDKMSTIGFFAFMAVNLLAYKL